MDGEFCPACRDWPIAPGDRFCGHCGALVGLSALGFQLDYRRPDRPALSVRAMEARGGEGEDEDTLKVALTVLDRDGIEHPLPAERDITVRRLFGPAGAPLTTESARLMSDPSLVLVLRAVTGRETYRDLGGERLAVFVGPQQLPARLELSSEPLLSDAVSATANHAEIRVRVRNTGGATHIRAARLSLDGAPGADETAGILPEPVFIGAGETVVVTAAMSLSEAKTTAERDRPLPAKLILKLTDADVILRTRLTRWRPATARLKAADKLAALAGRPARQAVRLTNAGGVAFRVASIEVRRALSDKALEHANFEPAPIPGGWSGQFEPGVTIDAEFRPLMPILKPKGPAQQTYIQEMRVSFAADGEAAPEPIHWRSQITVKRPAPFCGRLCVDFGTTESAAAAILGDLPQEPVGEPPESPFIVDLGAVTLDDGPPEARFLRTLVVRTEAGSLVCGEAARRMVEQSKRLGLGLAPPEERPVVIYEDFKWGLQASEEVAIAFLRHLRALIEEHPRVAAVIGPQTRMFATCPVRFATAERDALRKAFINAGFPDPLTEWLDVERGAVATFIAESWSPLPYALFNEQGRFLNLGHTYEHSVLPDLENGQEAHIAVYDVGGGSADVSVLHLLQTPKARVISEAGRATSNVFSGRRFNALIRKCISDWALAQGTPVGAAPESGFALDDAVRAFQYKPGLLSPLQLSSPMQGYFMAWPGLSEAERRSKAEDLFKEAIDLAKLALAGSAELVAEMNRLLPLPFGAAQADAMIELKDIPALAGSILYSFGEAFYDEVVGMPVADLKRRAAADPKVAALTRIVPSGRGAACPLADALILHGWAGTPICRLDPIAAKSITSWGGLHLCDLAYLGIGIRIEFGPLSDDLYIRNGLAKAIPLPWVDPKGSIALIHLGRLPVDARARGQVAVVSGRGGETFPVTTIKLTDEELRDLDQYWVGVRRIEHGLHPIKIFAVNLDEARTKGLAHD